MTAPVMLFAYSRPTYTRRVIEALSRNHLAKDTEVLAYICKPKNERHQESVTETLNVLRSYEGDPAFKRFTVVNKQDYVPLGIAMVDAVSEVISEYGRIIVLEDDIVTSEDFLDFMNDALDFYEDHSDIYMIGGYSFGMKDIKKLETDVYLVHRTCPWGWASWQDRWEKYVFDPRDDYRAEALDRGFRRRLLSWTRELPLAMDSFIYSETEIETDWDHQMCYCQFRNGMYTVCPKISKVRNIGFEGGTHDVPTGLDEYFIPEGSEYFLEKPDIDKGFQKRYSMKFIFGMKHKLMHHVSEFVFQVSPRTYRSLAKRHFRDRIG